MLAQTSDWSMASSHGFARGKSTVFLPPTVSHTNLSPGWGGGCIQGSSGHENDIQIVNCSQTLVSVTVVTVQPRWTSIAPDSEVMSAF